MVGAALMFHEDDPAFAAALDEHQERDRELASQRETLGNLEARRPDALRATVTYANLRVGDYMTAEQGRDARWVEVMKVKRKGDLMVITFRTPQPLGVGMHDRWVIERERTEAVVIDLNAR